MVSEKTNISSLVFIQVLCVPQQFMSWFGWPPDHMGWFALLLLVKFKTPGWFYFISYSYQVVHFGGWEHCVKVWWDARSKSKVNRPLFSLVLAAGDMICFVVKSEKGSVKQTTTVMTVGFSTSHLIILVWRKILKLVCAVLWTNTKMNWTFCILWHFG